MLTLESSERNIQKNINSFCAYQLFDFINVSLSSLFLIGMELSLLRI